MSESIIYLLVGSKGSGKTFIGSEIGRRLNVRFLRVEDIALNVGRGDNITDNEYVAEVFEAIEKGVRKELEGTPELVFESTGLTSFFDQMLENLRGDYRVILIGIEADKELCLERVKNRDQTIHINVSDHELIRINEASAQKDIQFDGVIHNNNAKLDQLFHEFLLIRKALTGRLI